jgi:hypothetical protein
MFKACMSALLYGMLKGHAFLFQGYSWEITTNEGGFGLHEILRDRKSILSGMCFSIIFLVPTFSSSYHEIFSMNQVFFLTDELLKEL